MSLWLRDEIVALLAPRQVTLVRTASGWRRGVKARQTLACRGTGEPSWVAPLGVLEEALRLPEWSRADLTVVLSNQFVRYQLTPDNPELAAGAEIAAYAGFDFERVHGAHAKGWTVRVSRQGKDQPLLASAIDTPLLDALRGMPLDGVKLRSVQPLLMYAFNASRKQVRQHNALYLLLEPGRLCVALAVAGHWTQVRNARCDRPEREVPAAVERELRLAGLYEQRGQIVLYAPDSPKLALPDSPNWPVMRLGSDATAPVLSYDLALGR